jgi:DNA gyrase/topoisomerase IV subunit A
MLDGFKQVHHRLLYAMHLLNLGSKLQPMKSARVDGDFIGKFHPHGDQYVYNALVKLAQDFLIRYPSVNGEENFGKRAQSGKIIKNYKNQIMNRNFENNIRCHL